MLKISNNGINFIKKWEQGPDKDFAKESYICSAGKNTIGYGHVILPGEIIKQPIDVVIAEKIFKDDIDKVEKLINELVKVSLRQGQFDALCSLVFNIGEDNFRHSTLLKFINKELWDKVPEQFMRWVYSRKKLLLGLQNRRKDEIKLWQSTN
jgi:lysozyme